MKFIKFINFHHALLHLYFQLNNQFKIRSKLLHSPKVKCHYNYYKKFFSFKFSFIIINQNYLLISFYLYSFIILFHISLHNITSTAKIMIKIFNVIIFVLVLIL